VPRHENHALVWNRRSRRAIRDGERQRRTDHGKAKNRLQHALLQRTDSDPYRTVPRDARVLRPGFFGCDRLHAPATCAVARVFPETSEFIPDSLARSRQFGPSGPAGPEEPNTREGQIGNEKLSTNPEVSRSTRTCDGRRVRGRESAQPAPQS